MSDKDTLDHIILYCHKHKLGDPNMHDIVSMGKFDFECHSHSTGNSLRCWVWNKENTKKREIINTTYWFHPRYCFNQSKWESGAWDNALKMAIHDLKTRVADHKFCEQKRLEATNGLEKEQYLLEKAEFEKQFLN